MDSLEIDGKEYIASREAARRHSYTTDYVGQLIRGGKIGGKKVGRTWYVEISSLDAYAGASGPSIQLVEPRKDAFSTSDDEMQVMPTFERAKKAVPTVPVRKAEDSPRSSSSYALLRYVPETDEEMQLPPLVPVRREPVAHISLNSIVDDVPIEERPVPAEAPIVVPVPKAVETAAAVSDWGWNEAPTSLREDSRVEQKRARISKQPFTSSYSAAFAFSIVLAALSLAFGALALVGVKEIDFKATSFSASITSIKSLGN